MRPKPHTPHVVLHDRHDDVVHPNPAQCISILVTTGRKALVDLIQHPFYRCQFDPHRADAGHRVVIVGEAMTRRVHCRTEIGGEKVRNDRGCGGVNVKPFSS